MRNASCNAVIPAGGSAGFGFQASYGGGGNPAPTAFFLNGVACAAR